MDDLEWPREIWMAERDDHDQGVVQAVLSEHATISRWEGDKERDREFHRYIDADIYESSLRYHQAKLAELRSEIARLKAHIACMTGAGDTLDGWTHENHEGAKQARKRWLEISRAALEEAAS